MQDDGSQLDIGLCVVDCILAKQKSGTVAVVFLHRGSSRSSDCKLGDQISIQIYQQAAMFERLA
jgi:hypothetical protein